MFHFPRSGLSCGRVLPTEPRDGSDETSTRHNGADSTSVNPTEREMGLPALIHPSCPGHGRVEQGGKQEAGVLAFMLGGAGDAPSPADRSWETSWRDDGC